MATAREAPTIVRAVSVTEDHLAVVLNDVIGAVTDENVHQIWHELAQDVGWCEYRRFAPQQVQSSELLPVALAAFQAAGKKRKAPDEAEEEEAHGGLGAAGKERKSGRRAGRKHKGHGASESVKDTNDMAVAIKPQVLKDSDFLIEETEGEKSDEASHPCDYVSSVARIKALSTMGIVEASSAASIEAFPIMDIPKLVAGMLASLILACLYLNNRKDIL